MFLDLQNQPFSSSIWASKWDPFWTSKFIFGSKKKFDFRSNFIDFVQIWSKKKFGGRKRNSNFWPKPEKKLKFQLHFAPKSTKIGPKWAIFGQNEAFLVQNQAFFEEIIEIGCISSKSAKPKPKSAAKLRFGPGFASAFGQKLRFWCLRPRFASAKASLLRPFASLRSAFRPLLAKTYARNTRFAPVSRSGEHNAPLIRSLRSLMSLP